MVLIRLTRKVAHVLNGIDLSHCDEGDVIELITSHAEFLIREGLAEAVPPTLLPDCAPVWRPNGHMPHEPEPHAG